MPEPRPGLSPGIPAEVLASLGSAAKAENPFGVMEFFDGVPLPATVSVSYDALDLLRGIDVFLNCVPGASMLAMRMGCAASVRGRTSSPALTRAAPQRRWC